MTISVAAAPAVTSTGKTLTLSGTPRTSLSSPCDIFKDYGVGDVVMITQVGPVYGTGTLRKPLVTTISAKANDYAVTLADAATLPLDTDDEAVITLGKDSTAAFQTAHDNAFQQTTHAGSVLGEGSVLTGDDRDLRRMKGEEILVPRGLYFVRGLNMYGSVSLRGEGRLSRLAPYPTGMADYMIRFRRAIASDSSLPPSAWMNRQTHQSGFSIDNIMFDGCGRQVSITALQLAWCDHFRIDRLWLEEFDGRALDFFTSNREATIDRVTTRWCGNATVPAVDLSNRDDTTTYGNPGEGHNNLFLEGCVLNFSYGDTVRIDDVGVDGGRTRNIFFTGCMLHGIDGVQYVTPGQSAGDAQLGRDTRHLHLGRSGSVALASCRLHSWGRAAIECDLARQDVGRTVEIASCSFGRPQTDSLPATPSPAAIVLSGTTDKPCNVNVVNSTLDDPYIPGFRSEDNQGAIWTDAFSARMGAEPASRERVRLGGIRQSTGQPNDGVIPDFVGQTCQDYVNGGLYEAIGTGAAEWRPVRAILSGVPASGTWRRGDIIWRKDPGASDALGVRCYASGTQGEAPAGTTINLINGRVWHRTTGSISGFAKGSFVLLPNGTSSPIVESQREVTLGAETSSQFANRITVRNPAAYDVGMWLEITDVAGTFRVTSIDGFTVYLSAAPGVTFAAKDVKLLQQIKLDTIYGGSTNAAAPLAYKSASFEVPAF